MITAQQFGFQVWQAEARIAAALRGTARRGELCAIFFSRLAAAVPALAWSAAAWLCEAWLSLWTGVASSGLVGSDAASAWLCKAVLGVRWRGMAWNFCWPWSGPVWLGMPSIGWARHGITFLLVGQAQVRQGSLRSGSARRGGAGSTFFCVSARSGRACLGSARQGGASNARDWSGVDCIGWAGYGVAIFQVGRDAACLAKARLAPAGSGRARHGVDSLSFPPAWLAKARLGPVVYGKTRDLFFFGGVRCGWACHGPVGMGKASKARARYGTRGPLIGPHIFRRNSLCLNLH
jgi:hypothetical protein